MFIKHTTSFAATAFAAIVVAATASAEPMKKAGSFPDRPLALIVPAGPGGGSDQLSRAMANVLPDISGVPAQVVNKPGGGALTAIVDYMAVPNDGYTILQHADIIATAYVSRKLQVNPTKDLATVAITQVTFSQLYIRSDEKRFSDWNSLLAYAKANPKAVTVANIAPPGSMERVNMLLLEQQLGFETTQISFDNPSERYAALVGGHVDVLFEQPGDVRQFLEAKQFKPILTFMRDRPSAFADTPSLTDVGATFAPLLRFRGFWVHADTPIDRKEYLAEALKRGYETKSFQDFNKSKYMHLTRSFYGPEDATKLLQETIQTYTDVYKKLGITQ